MKLILKRDNEQYELTHSKDYAKKLNISLNCVHMRKREGKIRDEEINLPGGIYFLKKMEGTNGADSENKITSD